MQKNTLESNKIVMINRQGILGPEGAICPCCGRINSWGRTNVDFYPVMLH